MIISQQHRFIFVAVPKTGTHAVRRALRQHLDMSDLEQVSLFVRKRFPFPEVRDIPHGHISVRQIRPVLGASEFDRHFRFAFVRNPYDRFVSFCAFISRATGEFSTNPKAFMRHVLNSKGFGEHLLLQPQHEFLVREDGLLGVDVLGRTENMQADYDAICARIGIPSAVLERVNSSVHRPFHDYYDVPLAQAVAQFYHRDFELFGYSLESGVE